MKKKSLEALGRVHEAAVDVAHRQLGQQSAAVRDAAGRLEGERRRLDAERQSRAEAIDQVQHEPLAASDLQRLGDYCDASRRREVGLTARAEQARERLDQAHRGEAAALEQLRDAKVEQKLGHRLRDIELARERARREQAADEEALEAWTFQRN